MDLVTLEVLIERLPFTMDEDEEREAKGALTDLSDDARHYGKRNWTPDNAPAQVKNLILRAAVRYMKNYEGYTQSRAGDESVSWSDQGEDAGAAHFTEREIKVLRELAGNVGNGFHSVGMYAYGRTYRPDTVGLVNDAGSDEPIQMFASEDPW